MPTTSVVPSHSARRYDLDWLRIGVIVLLIFFHSARVFDVEETFYVQNASLNAFLSYGVIGFYSRWSMELLFVISGMASWFAMGTRSGPAYLKERWLRLGVPLLFGLAVIVPPQAYLAQLHHLADPTFSYPDFLAGYFGNWSDLTGYGGTFTPAHLWFILFLLTYSILALPLFKWWGGASRAPLRERAAKPFLQRYALLAWVAPIALASALPEIGGKSLPGYFTYFVLGYVLAATPAYQVAIDRDRRAYAVLGIASWLTLTALDLGGIRFEDGSVLDLLRGGLRILCAWSWVLAFIGYGHAYLNRTHRWLGVASEGAFPVYVVHQTVLVIAAFYIVQLPLDVTSKYILLVIATAAGSAGLYALLRRADVFRVLIGLRSSKVLPRAAMPA